MPRMLRALLGVLIGTTVAHADPPQLRHNVVSSCGLSMGSAVWAVRGTVGQPAMGMVESETASLHHGFWNRFTIPTGIADEQTVLEHFDFSISRNVPNPFRFATSITYTVANGSAVRTVLTIYDIRGVVVRTLVDAIQLPGRYTVSWDGQDTLGRSVASGIYFSRFRSGSFARTGKLSYLK